MFESFMIDEIFRITVGGLLYCQGRLYDESVEIGSVNSKSIGKMIMIIQCVLVYKLCIEESFVLMIFSVAIYKW